MKTFYYDFIFATSTFRVRGIEKKTNAEFFKDIEVGDYIQLEIKMNWNCRTVQPVIVKNLTKNTETKTSQGKIIYRFHGFDLEGAKSWF